MNKADPNFVLKTTAYFIVQKVLLNMFKILIFILLQKRVSFLGSNAVVQKFFCLCSLKFFNADDF